jgi:tripartite-type tricarboxylate transporter receptor subunit TctC
MFHHEKSRSQERGMNKNGWKTWVAMAALSLCTSFAHAQTWPDKPVRIIVPFAAGGPADVYARALGQKLQDALGQPFIIEDRPGGGAMVGTEAAAKSPADGYTLLLMSNTHTVNESLFRTKPYVLMRDFVPVAPINFSDLVLVVHPSVPAKSLKELLELARSKPKALNYASSGPGTPYHMAGEIFKVMAGVDIVHVPYKGSAGARTDVMSGQLQMMFDAVTTMAPMVKSGQLIALGTTGVARSSVLPNVPTVAEAGVPGFETTIWLGVMAPAGTPRAIVDKLNAEITKITTSAATKEAWGKQGATPMSMTPDEFARYLRADTEKWARVVKLSGATMD